jgi:two-component system, LuxR family, response regulator FixJ
VTASRVIVIVDEDGEVRQAAAQLVEDAGHNALAFVEGGELLRAELPDQVDCVLLGTGLPCGSALAALRALAERHDGAPVLPIAGPEEVALVLNAIEAGAFDLAERPCTPAALLGWIDGIDGELDRSLAAARMMVLRAYPLYAARGETLAAGSPIAGQDEVVGLFSPSFPGHERLTPRERDTLALILKGASNKEAARTLGISPRTVEFHRTNIMRKLGARNAVELVGIVLGTG